MSDQTVRYTVMTGPPSKYIKLNVGGCLYYTTLGTLTKQDNMLRAMFSGRMEVLTDSEGWVLIDRDGKHFGKILNYLRDRTPVLTDSYEECKELMMEAKYFLIEDLTKICEDTLKHLEGKNRHYLPICRVPIITSIREEQRIVSAANKPCIKLLYNRSNNKYSYTSSSDENFLRNIELFDKLSLRFNGRIIFMKDVMGNNEICSWSFYADGRKLAEVCCTSIVYTTEKKQTKVEFPEAKIYEETLNALLYENRGSGTPPDDTFLLATRSNNAAMAAALRKHCVTWGNTAITGPSADSNSPTSNFTSAPNLDRGFRSNSPPTSTTNNGSNDDTTMEPLSLEDSI